MSVEGSAAESTKRVRVTFLGDKIVQYDAYVVIEVPTSMTDDDCESFINQNLRDLLEYASDWKDYDESRIELFADGTEFEDEDEAECGSDGNEHRVETVRIVRDAEGNWGLEK